DRGVFTDYNVTFYPVIYRICPDRILERVFTSETEAQLYQKVLDCQAGLSIEEQVDLGDIRIDPSTRSLVIGQYQKVTGLEVMDLQGRTVQRSGAATRSIIDLGELRTGVYLFRILTAGGPVVKRLFLN
ncbi:MAG: T9SS type A sorting domain-containing protein, partial [Flavobacteriales bacterium]|nr:T9SS type A sorting domain-containing protein [Flavobacteriales bacterium]